MNVILDVWDNEPHINLALLQRSMLGTPHIAGYSLDGKVRGTEMLYQAACTYLHCPVTWQAIDFLPPPPVTQLSFSNGIDENRAIFLAITTCYDVRFDDSAFRLTRSIPSQIFDQLRKNYPIRREFSNLTIQIPQRESIAQQLQGLGFKVTCF
jgi:erythronate-4-phosphate dehydrogenase